MATANDEMMNSKWGIQPNNRAINRYADNLNNGLEFWACFFRNLDA
jgi:hypothetical protein